MKISYLFQRRHRIVLLLGALLGGVQSAVADGSVPACMAECHGIANANYFECLLGDWGYEQCGGNPTCCTTTVGYDERLCDLACLEHSASGGPEYVMNGCLGLHTTVPSARRCLQIVADAGDDFEN